MRKVATRRARGVIRDIAIRLVREKKMAVLEDLNTKSVGATQMAGRDLLSALGEYEKGNTWVSWGSCRTVKANMAADVRPQQKMTDEEVMARRYQTVGVISLTALSNYIEQRYLQSCLLEMTRQRMGNLFSV